MDRLEFAKKVIGADGDKDIICDDLRCSECPYNTDTPLTVTCTSQLLKEWAIQVIFDAPGPNTESDGPVPNDAAVAITLIRAHSSKWKKLTRGDNDIRFYAFENTGTYPIHGAIYRNNEWKAVAWDNDGKCYKYARGFLEPEDLIPINTKKRVMKTIIEVVTDLEIRNIAYKVGSRRNSTTVEIHGDEYEADLQGELNPKSQYGSQWLQIFTKEVEG
jgi:hypothetical protein